MAISEEINDLRETLGELICDARASHDIFWALQRAEDQNTIALGPYSSFVSRTKEAHLMVVVMKLCALHEKKTNGERECIEKLLHLINGLEPHYSFEGDFLSLDRKRSAMQTKADDLREIRNKFFGHRLRIDLSQSAQKHAFDDTTQLLNETEELLKDISSYIDGKRVVYPHTDFTISEYKAHTQNVLNMLIPT